MLSSATVVVSRPISTGYDLLTIHCMDARISLFHHQHPSPGPSEGFMNRKAYLKDPDFDNPPNPFSGLDYVLCAVACLLSGIAFVPVIATMLVAAAK